MRLAAPTISKKAKVITLGLFFIAAVCTLFIFLSNQDIAVLSPSGEVADKQRNLIIFTAVLSLVVVLPVYAMLFIFAFKYRDGNKKAKYQPNWDHNKLAEFTWWIIPGLIILVLAVITWKSSHDLDPYKALASDKKPLNVQVIALQWKWLFIYPEQNIASVNYLKFPVDTPVNFQITADAPMNSFWIPKLGGQVYAMSGMSTKLHLQASEAGNYRGSSANISGRGFASMVFTAQASSDSEFDSWITKIRSTDKTLSRGTYSKLAKPSENNNIDYFNGTEKGLFENIVEEYAHSKSHHTEAH